MVGEGTTSVRVVAVTRVDRTWFPVADELLERGDLVRVMIPTGRYHDAAGRLGCGCPPVRRVLLLGGDSATERVAQAMLERRIDVVVAQPPERADDMAERLDRVATAARTDAANTVLRRIRGGIAEIATFLQGDAEVLEFAVAVGSPAAGSTVGELPLPAGAHLPAVVRQGRPVFTDGTTPIEVGDLAVIVTRGGPGTGAVRKLFE